MYSPLLIFNIHNIQEKFMNNISMVMRLVFLLMLITGLAACSGKDKVEATADNMTEQLRQEILDTVADADRANEAAELGAQLRRIFVDAQAQSKKDVEMFHSIISNMDSTDKDFNTLFDDINASTKKRQSQVLSINTKMKSLLTAEEWQLLQDAREKALKADLKLL
jgi:hypothetical protein